jgi:predicted DNA-binding transcriptional regulator YafY
MPQIKNALIRYRIIDRCLRNKFRQYPSKNDLREACEDALFGSIDGEHICDSTIEKDLFAMRMEHDAPIKYSKAERGYYYEDPTYSINEIPLTDDEREAIAFASKTLLQFKDSDVFKQFGSAIEKIADKVAVSETDGGEEFIQFESIQSHGGSEFLPILLGAIKERTTIQMEYQKFNEEIESRIIHPLLLKQFRNRWYLISFELKKEAYRTFALDRIDDISIQKEKFERPKDFDPDNFFKHAFGITSGDKPVRIVIRASEVASYYLDTLPLHQSQKRLGAFENGFRFELLLVPTEEFYRELMSYSGAIAVEEPINIQEELKNRANRILKGTIQN